MIMLSKRYCRLKSLGFGSVEEQGGDGPTQWNQILGYNRKNLENKSKQEVIMEESSKGDTSPRGTVLSHMMMMI
ncbi:hypothetical protein TNCV_1109611 [Trichonephila clavipes]|nr:hypothetical protein TNCV_1109611 [Trichonephila clavipes]